MKTDKTDLKLTNEVVKLYPTFWDWLRSRDYNVPAVAKMIRRKAA